jgi:hypothetical protein
VTNTSVRRMVRPLNLTPQLSAKAKCSIVLAWRPRVG